MTLLNPAVRARNKSQCANGTLWDGLFALYYPGVTKNNSRNANANGILDFVGPRDAEYLGTASFINSPIGPGVVIQNGTLILHRYTDKTYLDFLHQTNTFTIMICVTPLDLPGTNQTLMVTNDGTTSVTGIYQAINTANKFWTFISYGSAGNSTIELITTTALQKFQNYVLILTCDGATARAFINGSQDATTVQAAAKQPTVSGSNHELYLGGRQSSTLLLNGIIYSYGFWKRALTHKEILTISNDIYAPLRQRETQFGFVAPVVTGPTRFRPFFVSQRGMF
jgi:hypothetical protein